MLTATDFCVMFGPLFAALALMGLGFTATHIAAVRRTNRPA